jgi:hypothetical protein
MKVTSDPCEEDIEFQSQRLLANQAFNLQFNPELTKPEELKKLKMVFQQTMQSSSNPKNDSTIVDRIMEDT